MSVIVKKRVKKKSYEMDTKEKISYIILGFDPTNFVLSNFDHSDFAR